MTTLTYLACLSNLINAVKSLVIVAGIMLILIVVLKQPQLRRALFYIICVLIVISGILGAIGLHQELEKKSYTSGQITLKNTFDLEDHFNWGTNSIAFYHDEYDETDTYTYTVDLTKVSKFDGDYNKYDVYFNDYQIINAVVTSGAVTFATPLSVKLTDGTISTTADLKVNIQFLTDKTKLTLTTHGKQESVYLEKYFNDCGFKVVVTPQV